MSHPDNVVRLSGASLAHERARHWIMRIDAGPLSPEEREEMQAWLAESPEHGRILDSYAMIWSAAGSAKFPSAHYGRSKSSRAQRVRRWGWSAVSACAVAASVVAVVHVGGAGDPEQTAWKAQYSTVVGEHHQYALNDGSEIYLNTATATDVRFTNRRRVVVLERGEGLFKVAKDKTRPFQVVAGDVVVRAVGTRFSVRRLDSNKVDITVFEGVVEVTRTHEPEGSGGAALPSREPVRLAAGQAAQKFGDSVLISSPDSKSLNAETAWTTGRLLFDAEPLADVVAQVNRYTTKPLVLADPSLGQLKVSGAVATADLDAFIRSLELGFKLHAERRADSILISDASH